MAHGTLLGALLVAISVAGLFMIEGGISFLLFGKDVVMPGLAPDWLTNLQYDAELGWTNVPGFRSPDYYGPGRGLSIDERGIRCSFDDCEGVAEGRTGIICSGDSFTLGYGVGNQDTWCHLLSVDLPDVVTINMGQGGYGLDQAYLRYMRDGREIEHDVLLFAFIEHDFRRMGLWRFSGRPKPVLQVRDGQLVMFNVPVPRTAGQLSMHERISGPIEELGIVRLARRLDLASAPDRRVSASIAEISAHIILSLMDEAAERSITTVFVYLPIIPNHIRQNDQFVWRDHVHAVADSTGAAFIDLSPELRMLPPEEMRRLFIQTGDTEFPGAVGHYSAAGNRWVADHLTRHLREILGIGQ